MWKYFLPLLIGVALAGLLYVGLSLDPKKVPSALLDKDAPRFALSRLHDADQQISSEQLAGQVYLLNVWATWCFACRQEHEALLALERTGKVPIYGLNWKDKRQPAIRWLQQLGDPYVATAYDPDNKVGLDWGVYGAPETFVVDATGIVRYKHIGPLTLQDIEQTILPLVQELQTNATAGENS